MFNFFLNFLTAFVNSTSEGSKPRHISDDSDLIPNIKNGDVSSFEKLVERHKKRAYYAALGLVGDPETALDLTQEAWIDTYKAIGKFQAGRPFYPWFYSILVNKCKNFLRHKKVVDRVIVGSCNEEWLSQVEGSVFEPESLVEEREAKALVWKAIESLPEEQREIIVLAHFEGLSYEEISALVGVPKGTVMSRLFYARKKLSELLRSAYDE